MLGNNQYLNPWTEEETNSLKSNYKELSYKEIGEIINRSESSINHKAQRLGLKRNHKKSERSRKFMSITRLRLISENSPKIKIFQKGDLNPIKNPLVKEKARKGIKKAWKDGRYEEDVKRRKGKHISPKTEFKKGHIPHSKGKAKETYEPLKRASEKLRGMKRTIESRNKLSQTKTGKPNPKCSETRKRLYREGKLNIVVPIKNSFIERKIQGFLGELNVHFITHKYIKIPFGYQCDIFIPSLNLVIECDGNYWHNYPFGTEKDYIRSIQLYTHGFKLIRLWEHEIKEMQLEDFRNVLFNKEYHSKFIENRTKRGIEEIDRNLLHY